MPLSPDQLQSLSRWLDELMDLGPAEREAWLARLPADQQDLAETLREMLKAQVSTGGENFLASLPELREQPAAKDSPDLAHPGDRVGPYRLIREIGRGGMGAVWLAERADGNFKRQVALKLPRLAWGSGLAERMAREREIGAMLEHPNIARLYDAGVDELGRPYIAMEYIDGKAIDVYCRDRQLSVRERLKLLVQVARAVAYAHGRLIVHRDLKPSNVLVSEDGQAHLLDFGIAKLLDEAAVGQANLTQEQGRVLTPIYAAPEQLKGEPVTVQTDVYGLGLLAFEVLTNVLPYGSPGSKPTRGRELDQIILQGYREPASRKASDAAAQRQLRGDLDAVLGKALKVEPQERYRSADAMADDWQHWLENKPVSARPDGMTYRLSKAARRHWVGLAATFGVLCAIVVGGAVAGLQAQKATRALQKEQLVRSLVSDVFKVKTNAKASSGEIQSASTDDFLQHTAKLVHDRFGDQPAVQADLYGVVAKIFYDMRATRLAREYAGRQLEATVASNAGPEEQAQVHLSLARAQLADEKPADAIVSARKAIELADSVGMVRPMARVTLAHALHTQGDIDEAWRELDEVESQVPVSNPQGRGVRAYASWIRGSGLYEKNRHDEALRSFDQAIEMAIEHEGPNSETAIEARIDAAWQLATSTDQALSSSYLSAALQSMQQLGHGHRARAALVKAMFARNRYVNNAATFLESHGLLVAARQELRSIAGTIPLDMALELDFLEGSVLSSSGRVAEGLAMLDRAVPELFASMPSPTVRNQYAASYSGALRRSGQHAKADRWYRAWRDMRIESGGGFHPWMASDLLFMAINLHMAGDSAAAASIIDRAPNFPPFALEEKNPDAPNLRLRLFASEMLVDQGNMAGAMARFPKELLDSEQHPNSLDDDRSAKFVMSRILCAGERPGEGLKLAEEVLGAREAMIKTGEFEHDPELAYMRSLVALCAFKAGRAARAQALAAQAERSFEEQPQVSAFYLRPLAEYRRLTATKTPSRKRS